MLDSIQSDDDKAFLAKEISTCKNEDGRTVLHAAVMQEDADTIESILGKLNTGEKWNLVNVDDKEGKRADEYAERGGDIQMVLEKAMSGIVVDLLIQVVRKNNLIPLVVSCPIQIIYKKYFFYGFTCMFHN